MPTDRSIDPAASYTLREAAALKGVAPVTVRLAVAEGRLPRAEVGGRVRVPGAALLAWQPRPVPEPTPGRVGGRPVALPADVAAAVAGAGVDPRLPAQALEAALREAIARRRGYVSWWAERGGWVAELRGRGGGRYRGATLAEALGRVLAALPPEEPGGADPRGR